MTKRYGVSKPLVLAVLIAVMAGTVDLIRPAHASEWTTEEDLRNRIDFAGRQRMLTQQMTLFACFVMAGVEPERYIGKTESVVRQFENYLDALQNGSDDLRLSPEQNADVLDRFDAVAQEWRTLGPAVRQVIAGDLHAVPIGQVIRLNLDVLAKSHDAVEAIQHAYLTGAQDPGLAATIGLAGRQRMLSQKAAKDICFLNLGLGGSVKKARLADTLQEFRTAMSDLQDGAEARNVIEPPNRQVKRQLDRVVRVWEDFEELAVELEQNGTISDSDMVKLANLSQQVLLEMNLVIVMYTQS